MTTPIAAGPLDRRVGGCRPEETGVGDWCAPGPAAQQERKWILWFEDQDRSVSVFDTEQDGRDAFARAESHGWNCHLLTHVPRLATPNVKFSGTAKRSFDGSAGTQG